MAIWATGLWEPGLWGANLWATAAVAPTVTTTTLPDGQVGVAYTATLTATGNGPITWAVTVGTLPDGLSLDANTGVISGTPTTAIVSGITVEATNAEGSDTQELTLTIAAAAPVSISGSAGAGKTIGGRKPGKYATYWMPPAGDMPVFEPIPVRHAIVAIQEAADTVSVSASVTWSSLRAAVNVAESIDRISVRSAVRIQHRINAQEGIDQITVQTRVDWRGVEDDDAHLFELLKSALAA